MDKREMDAAIAKALGFDSTYLTTVTSQQRKAFIGGLRAAADIVDQEAAGHGGIAEGPIATEVGKMLHEGMAASAQNCAVLIRGAADELAKP